MLISEAMQGAMTPVFLIVGVGGLLNVMTSRLGRIKDRERFIYSIIHNASGDDLLLARSAITKLAKRSFLISMGIWLSLRSVLFVCLHWHYASSLSFLRDIVVRNSIRRAIAHFLFGNVAFCRWVYT